MPGVFANITKVPDEMVAIVADVLEARAAIPSQQEMIKSYLGGIRFPESAKVLEVGCGTGPVCRAAFEHSPLFSGRYHRRTSPSYIGAIMRRKS